MDFLCDYNTTELKKLELFKNKSNSKQIKYELDKLIQYENQLYHEDYRYINTSLNLISNPHQRSLNSIFCRACCRNCLMILKLMHNVFKNTKHLIYHDYYFKLSWMNDNNDIMKWLLNVFPKIGCSINTNVTNIIREGLNLKSHFLNLCSSFLNHCNKKVFTLFSNMLLQCNLSELQNFFDCACYSNNLYIAKWLLLKFTQLKVTTKHFKYACSFGHFEIAKLFHSYNNKINLLEDNQAPLQSALYSYNSDFIKWLY